MEKETWLAHAGRESVASEAQAGFVNPPLQRGSTVLYRDVAELDRVNSDPLKRAGRVYGRFGTPTSRALEAALAEMEGGHAAVCTGTGLSAITTAILALVRAGDHLLVTDSAYLPTRAFCDGLARFGITTTYYDPTIGAGIAELLQSRTRLVFMESPGSLTFDIQDVPAITAACRARGVWTLIDNTWATPLFHQPLRLGADVSIHSATKYITGHSDSYLGAIVCNEATFPAIRAEALRLGQCAGPDDVNLALRGLRTLAVRMARHQTQAVALASWLATRPEVAEVLYPALPTFPGHALWRRDFGGAAGVFSLILRAGTRKAQVDAMIDGLRLFGIGHSYGGFESLVAPMDPRAYRTMGEWTGRGPLVRLQVGLEDVGDLRDDLAQSFARALHDEPDAD